MTGLPSIYFRTDGNTEIATGHIMRCLTIARACIKNGACVAFIVSDEESRTLLRERFIIPDEFAIHCLHSDYHRMQEELPALIGLLDTKTDSDNSVSDGTSDRPWLFIDSYYATPAYLPHYSHMPELPIWMICAVCPVTLTLLLIMIRRQTVRIIQMPNINYWGPNTPL